MMFDTHWIGGTRSTTSPHHATNASIVRLCDAMKRTLPKKGNPARRALSGEEGNLLIASSDAKSKRRGDHWDRNSTILSVDLTTALRINDVLSLRHCDLLWEFNPLKLTMWLVDGKKDQFSNGVWSVKHVSK